MPTYVNDLRLKEIATGDEAGTWGSSTNTNLSLIGEALSFGTEAITTNADTHTTTVADGAADPGRAMYLKYTGTLDSACTITIGPNTISRMQFIENGTSGSQNIIISQGSGANVTIPPGDTKAVYLDGAGSGAAVVDAFASLNTVDLKVEDDLTVTDDATIGGTLGVTGVLTANAGVVVDNITIDGTEIDLSSGDFTLDVAGDIIFDADGENIKFSDAGTEIGQIDLGSQNLTIRSQVDDKDIIFRGQDGTSEIVALTLDMSDAGAAIFNHTIEANGYISVEGTSGNTGSAGDRWIGGDGTAGTWFYNVPTGSSHLFGINNSNQLVINGTGVGIGTSPNDKLHIKIGTNLNWQFGYPNSSVTTLAALNDAEDAYVEGRIDGLTTNINSQSGGNVGIGLTSPQKNLHIFKTEGSAGATHATIRLGGFGTVGADIAAYRVDGNSNNQGLQFFTNDATDGSVEKLRIDNAGITSLKGGTTSGIQVLEFTNGSISVADDASIGIINPNVGMMLSVSSVKGNLGNSFPAALFFTTQDSTVTVVADPEGQFSNTANTDNKINVYTEAGTVRLQNKIGAASSFAIACFDFKGV